MSITELDWFACAVLLRLRFGPGGAAQLFEQLGPAAVEHGVAEEAGAARNLG